MPKLFQLAMPLLMAAVCAVGPVRRADTESKPEANQGDADFAAGKKAIDAKDWNAAVAAFGKVVKRDAKNADAFNFLGYAYRWLGKMDESFANYR